jgi:nitroreductase/ferredoxin
LIVLTSNAGIERFAHQWTFVAAIGTNGKSKYMDFQIGKELKMSMISVDKEKCKSDGICVAECPLGLLEIKEKGATPTTVGPAEELCVQCGHCVAVCPHGALSHKLWGPEDFQPVRKELILNDDHAEHFLRARRSIRTYKKTSVPRETLSRLIEMASYAPSGHNSQPVNWLVLENAEEIQSLAGMVTDWMLVMIKEHPEVAVPMHFSKVVAAWERGMDRILRGAPNLIIAHAPKALMPAQAACTIALTYLELAATSLALGACWAGYFNAAANFYPPLMERLALPEGHGTFGAMMVGYPKYQYHRLPLRKKPVITWR